MRLRVQLSKSGLARFMSHLDLQRTLERSLRRASLPIAFSQGFTPRPRISFASALATGTSSEGEFIDVELTEAMEPALFLSQANLQCPTGVRLLEARPMEGQGDSLTAAINAAAYRLRLSGELAGLAEAVARLLANEEVMVDRVARGKVQRVNVRPLLYALKVTAPGELWALVQTGSQGNLKPEDLVTALRGSLPAGGAGVELTEVHRLMLYQRDPETGELAEPWAL